MPLLRLKPRNVCTARKLVLKMQVTEYFPNRLKSISTNIKVGLKTHVKITVKNHVTRSKNYFNKPPSPLNPCLFSSGMSDPYL